jgi:hypothetical protein
MSFAWLIVLGFLGYLGWKTWRFVQCASSPRDRAVAMRGAVAFWFIGFLVALGFVFVPMPFKLLFAIPAFLVSGTVTKAIRDTRARIQEEDSGRGDIEKMKRIN